MSSTLLAAGDQLIKLWPEAKLALPARESQQEDVGGYNFLILFSHDPRSWVSEAHIITYERRLPTADTWI